MNLFFVIFNTIILFLQPCLCKNETDYNLSKAKCSFEILRRNTLIPSLEGLVGVGWDNLMNIPLSTIFANNFSDCRTTPDGDFLIPNYLQVLPVKEIDLDRVANYFEHFKDAFEQTTFSINYGASASTPYASASGSFSTKYQETKEKMIAEKSSFFNTKVLYHAYTLIVQPDAELHPSFKGRLLAIDAALSKNLTRRARYLSEAIIREYGTHVLTRVEAGAKIEEEDFVESSVVNMKEENLFEFKSSIAGKFLINAFGAGGSMGMSYSTDSKTNETLSKATRHSHIKTFGGPTVNHLLAQTLSGAKPAEKTQFTFDELVALDVNGVPLYNLISERQILEIHPTRVNMIQILLKNATELYYRKNLYSGCTNTTAPNFNYQANHDDGNCLKPYNNYTFGGMYQTCTPLPEVEGYMTNQKRCDGLIQPNGITGGFSCPPNFDPIVIFDIVHQFPDWIQHTSYRSCHSCWLVARCCNTKYRDIVHQEKARITTHYCKAKPGVAVGQDQGYMFGGIFTSTSANPFTGSSNCPGHFQSIRIGLDITICVSRDYQLDALFNVQFAGFFSCQSPIQKCDAGYSQHLLSVLDGCEIYYCVRPEAFNRVELNPIKRPPFEDISSLLSNDTESTVYIYLDDQLIVKSSMKEILSNITLERANINGEKNSDAAVLREDQALDIWLDTMDSVIDEKLDKYYGATINQTAATLPPFFAPTLIPFVPLENIIPKNKLNGKSSSSISNNFSSGEIILLFGIFATVVIVTIGGILYHRKSKRRSASYSSLIENDNIQYNQIYENDNL